jgi:hypothetical protein
MCIIMIRLRGTDHTFTKKGLKQQITTFRQKYLKESAGMQQESNGEPVEQGDER